MAGIATRRYGESRYCCRRDEHYRFRDGASREGMCRVRVYEAEGRAPIIRVTEDAENPGRGITDVVEYLAAEVIARYLPVCFELEEWIPFMWIEEYPEHEPAELNRFASVTFSDYTPSVVEGQGAEWRVRIGAPRWQHLTPAAVQALLGESALRSGVGERERNSCP